MDNFLFLPRAAAAALNDLAFAALTGILLCTLWLPQANSSTRRTLHRTLLILTTLILLTLAAQIWLLTATMLGTTNPHQIFPELLDVLTSTHAGRILALSLLPALALLITAVLTRSRPNPALCLALAAVLVTLRAATGHAASNGDFTLDEALQLIHLASTAVWAGAIMAAGLLIAPHLQHEHRTLTHLGQRVSTYATLAIALVIATGIAKSWRGLDGSLTPLVHTQWGVLLTIKTTLVSAALLLGLYNRLLLRRNPSLTPQDALRFTRGLRFESLLMIAILTLSAFLANSPPALNS